MADVPVLVCTAGELSGKRIPVPEGGIGIGRSPENAVVIHDEGVSRYHARLLFENGSLWLQDAGSRNGVFVNGARVTGHKALKVGDSMTIAEHTFELRWQDEDSIEAGVRPAQPSSTRSLGPTRAPSADATDAGDGGKSKRGRWFWPFS
ncbi:MAG: FHA domain-containing protein [Alphaproteobacteria bacterium]|nr:FHA domain-containing protein [Alphaproteobacteria bacterium]MCB9695284.1 FHA domain-containing protein [Alphaproteobacteria bacterium]